MRAAAVALFAASALALTTSAPTRGATEEAVVPLYRVISVAQGGSIQGSLAAPGGAGYAIAAAGRGYDLNGEPRVAVLLEHTGHPVEHRVLETTARLDSAATLARMKELGGRGCELEGDTVIVERVLGYWLPETIDDPRMHLIFKCSPGAPAVDYEVVVFRELESLERRLQELHGGGFRVVGLWNSGRHLQAVVRRGPARETDRPGGEPRLFHRSTFTALRSALRSAIGKGLRVIAADDPSTAGAPLLLMDRRAAGPEPFEYLLLSNTPDKVRQGKLERKLRKRGKAGWRLEPAGCTDQVLTLSRDTASEAKYEYRVLSSRTPPGLAQALEQATAQGFRFMRLTVMPAETVIVLARQRTG